MGSAMPDINQSVALGVQPVDTVTPLLRAAQIREMQARGALTNVQAGYQGSRLNALQRYAQNPDDPGAFNQLAAIDPDLAKNAISARQAGRTVTAQGNLASALQGGDPGQVTTAERGLLAANPEVYNT